MTTLLSKAEAATVQIEITGDSTASSISAMLRNGTVQAGDLPISRVGHGYSFGVFVRKEADLPEPCWAVVAKKFGWRQRKLNCRRRGIGERLLNAAIDWAKSSGAAFLSGEVIYQNDGSHRWKIDWYRRKGFDIEMLPHDETSRVAALVQLNVHPDRRVGEESQTPDPL
jgi:hypothetical protein